MVRWVFGNRVSDVLSGYRVFSRRFVKSFPALAAGFETETEFTIHALELKMPIAEVPTPTRPRRGLAVQAAHLADGLRILRTIVVLVKEERPLQFFAVDRAGAGAARSRPRRPGGARVSAHRPGAAAADRSARDGTGAAGSSCRSSAAWCWIRWRAAEGVKRLAYLAIPRGRPQRNDLRSTCHVAGAPAPPRGRTTTPTC